MTRLTITTAGSVYSQYVVGVGAPPSGGGLRGAHLLQLVVVVVQRGRQRGLARACTRARSYSCTHTRHALVTHTSRTRATPRRNNRQHDIQTHVCMITSLKPRLTARHLFLFEMLYTVNFHTIWT